ncbi:hypothetical protein [Streptomyces sp. NPDC020983]|uniref:hypothetical protein n=1 Tax=Streptomyces sp. NPDC020983 TaxID=3365106 RepID=UPI003787B915
MTGPEDDRLREVAALCGAALRAARTALGAATEVIGGDGDGERVKASDAALHELRDAVECLLLDGTATAGLRAAVAAAHAGGDMGRVGELVQQVAEMAWSWHPGGQGVPPAVHAAVTALGGEATELVERAAEVVERTGGPGGAPPDADPLEELDLRLAGISGRQRSLDEALVADGPRTSAPDAVDIALLGRCYEGCAWHSVAAVRHLVLLAS